MFCHMSVFVISLGWWYDQYLVLDLHAAVGDGGLVETLSTSRGQNKRELAVDIRTERVNGGEKRRETREQ